MVAFKLSVLAAELAPRIRQRLRSNAVATATKVTWQRPDGQRLILDLSTLQVRLVDGWLVCGLTAQADQTGPQSLQFIYFLGRPKEADGMRAAGTVNAPGSGATRIAAVWGAEIQRVIWDAVLDFLEASVHRAGTQLPGQKLTLQGFHVTDNSIHAEVIAGDI